LMTGTDGVCQFNTAHEAQEFLARCEPARSISGEATKI
jgi:hypothetical protein